MEWRDLGIFLSKKPLGEHKFIYTFFTKNHGVYRGILSSPATLFLGNIVELLWTARLEEQLGTWTVEDILPSSERHHPMAFLYTHVMTIFVTTLLPERTPDARLFQLWTKSLTLFSPSNTIIIYALWEKHFMTLLGYDDDSFHISDTMTSHQEWVLHLRRRHSFFLRTWPHFSLLHKARKDFIEKLAQHNESLLVSKKYYRSS